MTDNERIDRLEKTMERLLDALSRKDTLQDGNWGWKTFEVEIRDLLANLRAPR